MKFTDEEILALIGQALGNWKLSFVIMRPHVDLGFGFFYFCLGRRDVFAAFGFNDPDRPIPVVMAISVVYGVIWTPISTILDYCMSALSRKRVFAVDRFVADLGLSGALQTALCKLQLTDDPDLALRTCHRIAPITNLFTHSKPSLSRRFKALVVQEQQRKLE